MKLKPGVVAEYKQRHDEIWPELAAAIRGDKEPDDQNDRVRIMKTTTKGTLLFMALTRPAGISSRSLVPIILIPLF